MKGSTAIDVLRAQREGLVGLQGRQAQRLELLMRFSRMRSPLLRERYRDLPIADVPLTSIPPVTKTELMADFDAWVTDPAVTHADVDAFVADPDRVGTPYLGKYFVCQSSGTTGVPGLFLHDRRAVGAYEALSLRIDHEWLTPRGWLSMLQHHLRWAAIVGTGGHYAGEGWMQWQRRRDPIRRRAFGVYSIQTPLPDLVDMLNDRDPAAVTTYPSLWELLAQEQVVGRLHLHPAMLETGGESLTDEARERIESAFGMPLRETYSSSEFLTMAYSCDAGWLHVNSDWLILEPVDRDGGPTSPGEASHTVLLTSLANYVQPIIRYDLGDSVISNPSPCACGNPLPAIRVRGRSDDVVLLPGDGGVDVAITPLALGSVVDQVSGVRRAQIVQDRPDRLHIRLQVQPGFDSTEVWPPMRERLSTYLRSQGVGHVHLSLDPELPMISCTSGKFRQVIALLDRRPPDR